MRSVRLVPSVIVVVGELFILSPLFVTWLVSMVNQAAQPRYLPTVYSHGRFQTPPVRVWWGAPYTVAIGLDTDLLDTPRSVKRSIPSALCQESKTLDWSAVSSSRMIKATAVRPTMVWCPDTAGSPVWWATTGLFHARFGHAYMLRIQAPAWAPRLQQEPLRVMIQMPAEGIIAPGLMAIPAMLLGVMVGLCVMAAGLVLGPLRAD
jgi:hypothetical protein